MSVPSAAVGTQDAPAVPAPPGLALVAPALLPSIQPFTTDVYLPALTRSLGAPVAAGQLTPSAMPLAFGCSQLVWKLLTDRFGRRSVLLTLIAWTLVQSHAPQEAAHAS
ncbi:hypothetical protein [Diaphorobacter sp.]|uniref:hypothetical protein n=1 Tax=Diaphorobacter sp. TaxID=1934310 RepID=UPI003D11D257